MKKPLVLFLFITACGGNSFSAASEEQDSGSPLGPPHEQTEDLPPSDSSPETTPHADQDVADATPDAEGGNSNPSEPDPENVGGTGGSSPDGMVGGDAGSDDTGGSGGADETPSGGSGGSLDPGFVRPIANDIVPGVGPEWVQDTSEPCKGHPMEDDDFYSMRIDMNSSAMPIFNEEWRLCDSPTQGFDCAVCNYNFCTSTRMGKLTAKHLKYDLEIWGEDEDGVKLFSISFDPFNMSCQARFTAGRHQTLNVTFSKR